jgi:hypothetical protein
MVQIPHAGRELNSKLRAFLLAAAQTHSAAAKRRRRKLRDR